MGSGLDYFGNLEPDTYLRNRDLHFTALFVEVGGFIRTVVLKYVVSGPLYMPKVFRVL